MFDQQLRKNVYQIDKHQDPLHNAHRSAKLLMQVLRQATVIQADLELAHGSIPQSAYLICFFPGFRNDLFFKFPKLNILCQTIN